MDPALGHPRRRRCWVCGRSEQTSWPIHLVTIMVDAVPRRACDKCRSTGAVVWTCQSCARDQGGQRHRRGGLVVCTHCDARLAAQIDDDAAGHSASDAVP